MSLSGNDNIQVVLVGTGSFALNALRVLENHSLEVAAFVDEFRAEPYLDRPVYPARNLPASLKQGVSKWLVAISDPTHANHAELRLQASGISPEQILLLGDDPGLQILDLLLTRFGSRAREGLVKAGITSLPEMEEEFLGPERRATLNALDPGSRTIGLGYFGRGGGFRRHISMLIPRLRENFNVLTLSDEIHDEADQAPDHLYIGSDSSRTLTNLDLALSAHVFPCGPATVPRTIFSHVIYDLNLTAEYQLARLNHHDTNYIFASSRPAFEGWKKQLKEHPVSSRVCLVPGGYLSLDRSIAYFDELETARDSIIYAPTLSLSDFPTRWPFSDLVTSIDAGPEILRALLDEFPDHRVIFRPHPADLRFFDLKRGDPREKPFGQMLELCREHNRCSLDDASDYGPSYGCSAVMVSDTSSTAFTFALATGRPVVFFCKDDQQLTRELGEDLRLIDDRREVGSVAENVADLVTQVKGHLEVSRNGIQKRESFRDRMIFNVGGSANYFMNNIEFMLSGEQNPDWTYLNW